MTPTSLQEHRTHTACNACPTRQTQTILTRLLAVALGTGSLQDQLHDALHIIATLPWQGIESQPTVCWTDHRHHTLTATDQAWFSTPSGTRCERVEARRCICRCAATSRQLTLSRSSEQSGGHLCVPILSGTDCLGVLTLPIGVAYQHHADCETLLVAIANILALMMERTRSDKPETAQGTFTTVEETVHGARVLLVEDNDLNQQMAREVLRDMGAQVWTACNGAEAVTLVTGQPFDLVLMDLHMPIMDGLEATRRIRMYTSLSHLPIIAMTANLLDSTRKRCLDAGMNAQVAKPICRKDLYAALCTWMPQQGRDTDGRFLDATPGIPSPRPPLSAPVPGVNVAECLERLGGNSVALRNLLLAFRQEYAESARQIRTLLYSSEIQDRERARHLAHALNGMAANLAAVELNTAASTLETGILEGEVTRWPALLDSFEQALQRVLAAIDAMAISSADSKTVQPETAKGEADAIPLLLDLAHAVYRQNFKARQFLATLRPWLVSQETRAMADHLESCLARYDYPQARHHLTSLASAFGLSLQEEG